MDYGFKFELGSFVRMAVGGRPSLGQVLGQKLERDGDGMTRSYLVRWHFMASNGQGCSTDGLLFREIELAASESFQETE